MKPVSLTDQTVSASYRAGYLLRNHVPPNQRFTISWLENRLAIPKAKNSDKKLVGVLSKLCLEKCGMLAMLEGVEKTFVMLNPDAPYNFRMKPSRGGIAGRRSPRKEGRIVVTEDAIGARKAARPEPVAPDPFAAAAPAPDPFAHAAPEPEPSFTAHVFESYEEQFEPSEEPEPATPRDELLDSAAGEITELNNRLAAAVANCAYTMSLAELAIILATRITHELHRSE